MYLKEDRRRSFRFAEELPQFTLSGKRVKYLTEYEALGRSAEELLKNNYESNGLRFALSPEQNLDVQAR
jgi:hypothetical protein